MKYTNAKNRVESKTEALYFLCTSYQTIKA